jgi:hypothetical protein
LDEYGQRLRGRHGRDDTIGGTPIYLAIMRYRSSVAAARATLHRFNVYPAPGFFTG